MKHYFSQRDPRWHRKTLGNTIYTIYRWGCKVTTACNMIMDLFDEELRPDTAAELWKFTKDGKLIHDSIKFKGMEYKRYWRAPTHKEATAYDDAKDTRIGVRMKYNPLHWVKIHKWTKWYIPWFLCVDPYSYNPDFQCARIVRKMKYNIDGFFTLKKV